MTCDDFRDRLDDWVAGRLAATEASATEAHAAGCPECALDAEAARVVRRAVAGLPAERRPDRELWGGIEARIAAPVPRRRVWAAAAVVALAASVGLWVAVGRAPVPQPPAPAMALTGDLDLYRAASVELRSALDPAGLSAPLRASLERDLPLLDEAITEVEARMATDPTDPDLRALAESAWRRKLELLRRIADLAAS